MKKKELLARIEALEEQVADLQRQPRTVVNNYPYRNAYGMRHCSLCGNWHSALTCFQTYPWNGPAWGGLTSGGTLEQTLTPTSVGIGVVYNSDSSLPSGVLAGN